MGSTGAHSMGQGSGFPKNEVAGVWGRGENGSNVWGEDAGCQVNAGWGVRGCWEIGIQVGGCWKVRQRWHWDGSNGPWELREGSVGSQYQHLGAVVCWQDVVQTRGFHELSDTVLAQVLRSDRLAVDELDLVQAVREWAHVSSVSAIWQ